MMGSWQSVAFQARSRKDIEVGQYTGLIWLAIPLLLLYMVVTRTRRQQRALATAQAAVRPGSRVMTTSGVHATVVSVDDSPVVVLEIAPGVHTRWARQAIAEVFDAEALDAETLDAGVLDAGVLDAEALDHESAPDAAPAGADLTSEAARAAADGHPNEHDDLRSGEDRDDRKLI
jgi:preprotein translocase subunit YajC